MIKALPLLAAAALAACAPKPVLYPNGYYQQVGQTQAQADVADCRAKAKKYLKDHKDQIVAGHTVLGAALGGAIGLVSGAFVGEPIRGAAEGAAIGGTIGVAQGAARANTPDAVERRFVDKCLTDKGYEPIGWR